MRIRQTQVLLALVTTVFCTMAFSSTATDQAGDPARFNVIGSTDESEMQLPLLLAKAEKFTVCVLLPSGVYVTKELTETQIDKRNNDQPKSVTYGACETSPSKS
jgi:hypothetical protein